MFCENCGVETMGDADFCEGCGKPFGLIKSSHVSERSSDVPEAETTERKGNVTVHGSDLQWIYEFSFWRNPAILITLSKVLLISVFVVVLFMFIITLGDGFVEALRVSSTILGYGIPVMAVLLGISYLLVGLLYGGTYCVLFKMDDNGVYHIQLNRQFKKAQALGFLTALVGLSGGNLSAGGAGLLAATRQSLYTSFKKVKSVKVVRSRNTIYINESMTRNQVYVADEDFDFVLDHILKKCPKKIRITGNGYHEDHA